MSTSNRTSHPFIPATPGDRRSPCPALNALANHGYLPRNGQNIGLWHLIRAVQEVYNLSFILATLLALAGILLCGHAFRLDLDALAIHNKIEHDASLVHADASGQQRAPTEVDPKLLKSFLSHADPQRGTSLYDLAQVRISREAQLAHPLDLIHSQIGAAEAALCWLLLKQDTGRIPSSILLQWYGEERLPDNWARPRHVIGLLDARAKAAEVAHIMNSHRKSTWRGTPSSYSLNAFVSGLRTILKCDP
ncbi:Chloroperoxidase [Suillus fuscotomentosus]|uniref:Chloroperoxidase n=1 Tax=Suillus fuscotomentosus TaxID=1912939 RepID=A0AAD4HDV0_9AGAM|nr:Chloroperoxidase [Suillus fuscotomentosus]KAG1893970.1 Chloroperoxidase [Suillus fuscotomentosus]